VKKVKEELILKDWKIEDVLRKYPGSEEIMLSHGLHCVGCKAALWETLEQGIKAHGFSDEKVNELVLKLNVYAKNIEKYLNSNDSIILTDIAVKKMNDLMQKYDKKSNGLKIGIISSGCCGLSYSMDFREKPDENDTILEIKGIKVFVDKEQFKLLKCILVDYVDSLQGEGFKILNLATSNTCD